MDRFFSLGVRHQRNDDRHGICSVHHKKECDAVCDEDQGEEEDEGLAERADQSGALANKALELPEP